MPLLKTLDFGLGHDFSGVSFSYIFERISPELLEAFCDYLQKSQLVSIDIIGPDAFFRRSDQDKIVPGTKLLSALAKCNHLNELNLKRNIRVSADIIKAPFIPASLSLSELLSNRSIRRLNLSSNSLSCWDSNTSFQIVTQAIAKNSTLTDLDLTHNSITYVPALMKHLLNALANHPSLLRLSLWIDDETDRRGHNPVDEVLGFKNSVPEVLDLWNNFIARCRLKAIDFGRANWLCPSSYFQFANALLKNRNISHASLDFDGFFDNSANRRERGAKKKDPINIQIKNFQALLDTFSKNDCLTSLALSIPNSRYSKSKISTKLLNFISSKRNLESLFYKGLDILDIKVLKEFLEAIASNKSLVSLEIRSGTDGYNQRELPTEGLKLLTRFALSNFKLTKLCFSIDDSDPNNVPFTNQAQLDKIMDIVHFRLLIRASNAIALRAPGDPLLKKDIPKVIMKHILGFLAPKHMANNAFLDKVVNTPPSMLVAYKNRMAHPIISQSVTAQKRQSKPSKKKFRA